MPDPIEFEWLMDAQVQVLRPIQIGEIPYGFHQAVLIDVYNLT